MIRRSFLKALAGFVAAVPFVRPRPRPAVIPASFDPIPPPYQFSVSMPVPVDDRQKYFQTLTHLTGRYNDALFHGYARGELLLRGARVKQSVAELHFEVSPYAEYLPMGYRGWDYRSVKYLQPYVRGVEQPSVRCVEQLYDAGDFSKLGV